MSGVETVDENALTNFNSLKLISMGSAKLQCNCQLYSALYLFVMARVGINIVSSATCVAPESLKGFQIKTTNIGNMVARKKQFICSKWKYKNLFQTVGVTIRRNLLVLFWKLPNFYCFGISTENFSEQVRRDKLWQVSGLEK